MPVSASPSSRIDTSGGSAIFNISSPTVSHFALLRLEVLQTPVMYRGKSKSTAREGRGWSGDKRTPVEILDVEMSLK